MDAYLGMIIMFAGSYEPMGWMFCDGRLLQIRENQALFAVIGTYYGGDGVSTFALPDLRGRVPLAPGKAPDLATTYTLATKAGAETVRLSSTQLPAHNHTFTPPANTARGGATATSPEKAALAVTKDASYASAATAEKYMMGGITGSTGGTDPVSLIQPCLPINFLICVQGLFPSRQ